MSRPFPAVRRAGPGKHLRLPSPRCGLAGFTLLELMTTLLVVSILCVMSIPVFTFLVARSQKVKCIANLKSLHVAATTYVRDTGHWPQLTPATFGDTAAAQGWIDAFRPYGLEQINWICPAIQKALQSPDLSQPDQVRVDYFATSFNAKSNTPFAQSKQPWFAECADVHGNGQEIIFPDGHIEEAGDLTRGLGAAPSPGTGH